MVSFPDAVKLFFQRYTDFKGRSRRSEYWWVALFNILVLIIPYGILVSIGGLIDGELNLIGMIMAAIVGLYALAIIVPSIALGVRRFHDLNQTGWLFLVFMIAGLIPLIGLLASIGQIIWFCMPGTTGPNKYGEDPRGGAAATVDTFS